MDNRHLTKQELANQLNISTKTLYRLMKKLGILYSGNLLSPSECAHIAHRIDQYKFLQNFGQRGENSGADSEATG